MTFTARRHRSQRSAQTRTVLFAAQAGDDRWLIESLRPSDRIRARWCSFALDAQLAGGASSDDDRLRAVRASMLVSPTFRDRLAGDWQHVINRVRTRHGAADPRGSLPQGQLLAVEADIDRLLAALRAPLPVPVRGVAMANLLLTDGAGPLHNPRRRADLRLALQAATGALDPWAELSRPTDH